jgi:hypothetical protein
MKSELICAIVIVVALFVLYKVFNKSSEGYGSSLRESPDLPSASYDFLSPSAESITDPYWRYYAFAGRHL